MGEIAEIESYEKRRHNKVIERAIPSRVYQTRGNSGARVSLICFRSSTMIRKGKKYRKAARELKKHKSTEKNTMEQISYTVKDDGTGIPSSKILFKARNRDRR